RPGCLRYLRPARVPQGCVPDEGRIRRRHSRWYRPAARGPRPQLMRLVRSWPGQYWLQPSRGLVPKRGYGWLRCVVRSEERRVGKECGCRWSAEQTICNDYEMEYE